MNTVQKTIQKIDNLQRHHRSLAFSYAVIKKYSEDEAGHQAALLTYYAFLSLFPLLLVLSTLTTDFVANNHPQLRDAIIKGTTDYFPVLGSQLSAHVHSLHKNGLALLAGLLFTLYGTRGVADAFRHGVQHIWKVPKSQRDGFPKSTVKSFGLIVVGGLGFIAAAVITGLTATAGHGLLFRLLSIAINLFMLFWLFTFLLNISLPRHVPIKQTRAAAITAAIGLVVLQVLGSYLLRRELKNLDAFYSYFALALGLLFWIYLQVQVLFYSLEIAAVGSQKLWPRSLSGDQPTAVDKHLAGLTTDH